MRFSHDTQPAQMPAPIIEGSLYRQSPAAMPEMPVPISAYPQIPPMPDYAPTVGLAQPEAPAPLTTEAMIAAAVDQAYQEAGWDLAKTPAALGMPSEEQLAPAMASSSENGDLSWLSPNFGAPLHEGGTTNYSPADNGSGAGSSGGGRGGRGRGRGFGGGSSGSGNGNNGGNGSGNQNGQPEANGPDDNEFIRQAANAAIYAARVGSVTEEALQRELNVDGPQAARVMAALQQHGVINENGRSTMSAQEESAAAAKMQVALRGQQAAPQAPALPQLPPLPPRAPRTPDADAGDASTDGRSLTGVFKNLATRASQQAGRAARATRNALVDSSDSEHTPMQNTQEVLDTYTAHLPKKAFETHDVSVADDVASVRAELVDVVRSRLNSHGWYLTDNNNRVADTDGRLPNDDPRVAEILAYQGAIGELAPKIQIMVEGLFNNYDPNNPDTLKKFVELGTQLTQGQADALGEEVWFRYEDSFDIQDKVTRMLQKAGYKVEDGQLRADDGSFALPTPGFHSQVEGLALAEAFKAQGLKLECSTGTHDTKDLHDYTVKVTDAKGVVLMDMPHVSETNLYQELSNATQTAANTTGSFRLPSLRRNRTTDTEPESTPATPEVTPVTPEAEPTNEMLPQALADALKSRNNLDVYSGETLVKAAERMGIKREAIDSLTLTGVDDETIVIVDAHGNFVLADREIFESDERYRDHVIAQALYLGSADRQTNPDPGLELSIYEPLRPNRTRLGGNTMRDYLEEVSEEGPVMHRLRAGVYGLGNAVVQARANRKAARAAKAAAAVPPVPPTPEELRRKRMMRRRAASGAAAIGLVASAVLGVFASENSGSDHDVAQQPGVSASATPHASHQEASPSPSKASPSRSHASEAPATHAASPSASPDAKPSPKAPEQGGGSDAGSNEHKTPKGANRIVHAGNETITFADDGSVVIKLDKGGTFSEGIHAAQQDMAERHLAVDASTTATYKAVQSMHLKPGEDRKQQVGSTYTFVVGKDGQLSMKESR